MSMIPIESMEPDTQPITPKLPLPSNTARISPPNTTTSDSLEYSQRLADISSRACFSDPLNILFQRDRIGPTATRSVEDLYTAALARLDQKVTSGSIIVEADNFAAVACWEPPSAVHRNHTEEELLSITTSRPIFGSFLRQIEEARLQCLGEGQKCWQLSLMARDPLRTSKGAVRAVIEPFVAKAKEEGMPVWLVAGNERARDVYAYFGFVVVRVVVSGEEKVRSWCMVANWPPKTY